MDERGRREFVKALLMSALGVAASPLLPTINAAANTVTITVLHTNDTHSQIDPFPAGTRNEGMGGVARRATLVRRVRAENPYTLLLDAGDMFSGTPYFNFFHGEVEIKSMSAIGYDVVTLGNHDFDDGVESLVRALKHASFEVVSANYEVAPTSSLKPFVKPYVVRTLAGIRIGIFGMGIDLSKLVLPKLHQGVVYREPLESARNTVAKLRGEEKVDLVICISHLGHFYKSEPERICDVLLAKSIPEIDFIVGGHTHTFMKEPEIIKHANGRQTLIFQVGYGGINVGRVDFTFTANKLVGWHGSLLDKTV
ncbi:MAG: metallophosphatase [Acidobacteriota bacterium]